MVMVELTAAPDGVTEDGANEHASPDGRPEQVKLTGWLNPLVGVTVKVMVVDCPELTAALDGEEVSENEGTGMLIV